MAAELPGDVDFVRVDRHGARNERDVIEPVRDPRLPPAPDPHPHRLSSPSASRQVPCPRSPYIGIGPTPSHYISCEYTRRVRRVSTLGRRGVRFLVEEPQPHEPEMVVHALDRARDARDERGEPARPDHPRATAHPRPPPPDQPADESGESVDRARLDI